MAKNTLTMLVLACAFFTGSAPGLSQTGPGDAPRPAIPPPPDQPRGDLPRTRPPGASRSMRIPGRIITGASRLPADIVEVRIETAGRVRIAFAYADGSGEFEFRNFQFQPGEFYYVVTEVEGFEPVRERLSDYVSPDFGGQIPLFLRPLKTELAAGSGDGGQVVDIRQLSLNVPKDALDDFDRAREFSEEGRDAEALEILEDLVQRVPEFYDAVEALGMTYFRLGRFEHAADALSSAHELSPATASVLLNLGAVLYRQAESLDASGETGPAMELFRESATRLRESIDRDPFSGPAHLRLGAALYELGELEDSEATLRRSLELDSELLDSRLVLANVYVRQSRFVEALDEVNLFLEARPDSGYGPALEQMRSQIQSRIEDPNP